MSDEPRRRRKVPIRWITLAEAVAIGAVLISGLGLYNSWSDRRDAPAPAAIPIRSQPLVLRATADKEGQRLAIAAVRDAQVIQSQTIAFPTALGVARVETTGDPRIEAGWLDALKKLGGKAGAGDRRLPVLLTTGFIEDGVPQTDTALYDLGYAIEEGGLFGGSRLRLRGLSLVARGVRDGQKRLDARWKPPAR